jgi:hypothetical protein
MPTTTEITGYPAIDLWANYFLPRIKSRDAARFRKKLVEQKDDHEQLLHTLRELILGGFLANNGFHLDYEREFDGQTPEWTITDSYSRVIGIVELINFHGDIETEKSIKQALKEGRFWVGYQAPSGDRLYDRLREKFSKYKELANREAVPYVVAVQIEFGTSPSGDELHDNLFGKEHGLFSPYPEVSGLIYFADGAGYYMNYMANPHALRAFTIPPGNPRD